MRIITKIFNNNIVNVVDGDGDGDGEDVILVGGGVGYLTSKGKPVDESRVEREFHLTGVGKSGAFRVLLEVPYRVLRATSRVSELLDKTYGIRLPATVEVGLADHLAQSIRRIDDGIPLYNSMLWETKMTYPAEFAIALHALDIIHADLGCKLPLDEAGFITLHLVNAGLLGDPGRAMTLGTTIRAIIDIVRVDLGIDVDGSTTASARFLTHIKFVVQRLTRNRVHHGAADDYYTMLIADNPQLYACASHIGGYLDGAFEAGVTDEEKIYLLLHLITLRDEQRRAADI
ncbi:PRD domain-containing protein [Microbacterium sp. NPDC076911]|uniref:PRD domain-containing protein n=1 Tax=Microbacterium sp. NPDC076911 TaxID=3154958 RepID=UPI00341BBFE5